MINFEELIKNLILPLVAYPNDVLVENVSSDDNLSYKAYVNPNDLGRVIGKGGQTAKAIRTVYMLQLLKNQKEFI